MVHGSLSRVISHESPRGHVVARVRNVHSLAVMRPHAELGTHSKRRVPFKREPNAEAVSASRFAYLDLEVLANLVTWVELEIPFFYLYFSPWMCCK